MMARLPKRDLAPALGYRLPVADSAVQTNVVVMLCKERAVASCSIRLATSSWVIFG